MKIIDNLKKVNLIQFVPAIFVVSLVGNSIFGYTAPKANKSATGEKKVEAATTQQKKESKKAKVGDIDLSKIKDGTYEGQANGYRGLVKVAVTVKDHKITAIKVLSNSDDAAFFNRASAGVIKSIIDKQSLKVDVVSGATYSSNGIIKAVKNALTGEEDKSSAKAGTASAQSAGNVGSADESGTYKDGTFTGSAAGYHGTVKVSVTIKDNKIKSIKILENHDDAAYFNRAKGILLPLMIKKQSTNVDAVSGATFSSNGIIKAVRNALSKAAVSKSTENSSESTSTSSKNNTKKNTTEKVSGTYKDGVYEGTGKGFRGNITVSVRIKQSKIVEIKLVKNEKDDAAYFNRAWAEVPYSIIAMQTANTDQVDAVSGATYSSNGIMEAVRNALKKAIAKKDDNSSNSSNSNNNNNGDNNTSKDDNTGSDPSDPTTPSEPETTDKVYQGTAICEPDEDEEFYAYRVTLEVVVSKDGTIKAIQNIVWSDRSMRSWYSMAEKKMPEQLLASGMDTSKKYDTVSGATCSSNALIKAYKNAIEQIK